MPEAPEITPQAAAPAERPPFAGFFFRVLAFILDCVLLYYVFKVLDITARPALLALNPALPYLAHLVIFLYFWIGYGPLTKGQTAAKALTGLQVVNRNGQPLGWGAAARRALITQSVFALFLGNPTYALIFPAAASSAAGMALTIASTLGLTTLAALALTVAIHPRKQGWHDLWAGSYVTNAPAPPAFHATLATEPNVVTERKIANIPRMSLIFWGIASIVLTVLAVKYFLSPEPLGTERRLQEASKGMMLPGYRLVETFYPDTFSREKIMEAIPRVREGMRTRGETVESTETLLRRYEAFNLRLDRMHGAVTPANLREPAFQEALNRLRLQLWREWQARPADRKTSASLEARDFMAVVVEPLSMVMYNGDALRGRVHGPADPAQGGLIFEDVLQPVPQTTDQPTTATATPAAARPTPAPRP